jgi:hypothetical protein
MARWAEVSRVVDADAAPELIDRLAGMGAVGIQEDYLPGEAPPFRQPWDTGPPPEEPARRVIKAGFEEAPGILLEAELDALVGPGATLSWQSDGDWAESWSDRRQQARNPLIHWPRSRQGFQEAARYCDHGRGAQTSEPWRVCCASG